SPSCALDEVAKLALVRGKIDALPAPKKEDLTGLRLDLTLENAATGEVRWVDVTAAHTGAESYKEKELKAIQARQVAATFSSSLALPDPGLTDPSPTLLERCATKNEKYCRLVQVARKQALEQKRLAVPTFHLLFRTMVNYLRLRKK